jgi:copper chaperone NosL
LFFSVDEKERLQGRNRVAVNSFGIAVTGWRFGLKKQLIVLFLLVFALLGALSAFAQEDIEQHRSCDQCGMDRKAFDYSRMLIVYEDGSQMGVCSLHCAVTELNEHKGKKVKSLLVADRDTRNLIDAEKAVWVLGGKKRGVMTDHAKWAFATTTSAQAFIKTNEGKIVSWEEALAAAREDAGPKQH